MIIHFPYSYKRGMFFVKNSRAVGGSLENHNCWSILSVICPTTSHTIVQALI